MAYLGVQPQKGQNRKLDNISADFNGGNVTFNLATGGAALTPATAYQLFISVGGVLQDPGVDFTVNGNQITFTTAPATGLSFFGLYQGDAIDSVSVSDGAITSAKLATGLTVTLGAGSTSTPSVTFAGDTNTGIYSPAADTIGFVEGGTEVVRIDASGRLLVGTSTARANFNNSTETARTQIEGTTLDTSSISLVRNTGSGSVATGGAIRLARSGADSINSNTVVASGNGLGYIEFSGADGTEFVRAAVIAAEVDGTPGSNDMPGRLVFSTTADGASTPTERMRIRADGSVRVSGTAEFGDNTGDGRLQARGIFNGSGTDTKDTGISVNAGNAGAAYLMLVTRNTSTGDNTQTALYFLRFRFDGNIGPTVTLVSGTNFITFGVSGSNTLTIASGSSGNWNAAAILVD